MKKIPTIFQRNHDTDRLVRNEVTPGCEWVLAGEGMATRKFDGTCCLIRDGKLYKRYEVKPGKNPPRDFEPACAVDPVTGKWQGWVPVGDGPEDQYHREAFDAIADKSIDGTYELVGPKINGGAEQFGGSTLIKHGLCERPNFPRDFGSIKYALSILEIEGIVWHHPDGRMAKIKRRDFGFPWPVKREFETAKPIAEISP